MRSSNDFVWARAFGRSRGRAGLNCKHQLLSLNCAHASGGCSNRARNQTRNCFSRRPLRAARQHQRERITKSHLRHLRSKCISRESNPGHIDGDDVFCRSFCLRPAIVATSVVACSVARVGCERLTVESLRELHRSRFCSPRTSGRRRATGRRPALRQYLPWAVPHPGTNRAPRRLTSEASWSLALPSRVQARMLVCFAAPFSLAPHSWVCVLEQTRAGLCPRARSLPARASENIKRAPGLRPWRGSAALSVRERVKFSSRRAPRAKLLLRPAIAATSAVACSAARVGCERLTVESLRELRGSRFALCECLAVGARQAVAPRCANTCRGRPPTPVLTGLCAA